MARFDNVTGERLDPPASKPEPAPVKPPEPTAPNKPAQTAGKKR